MDEIFKRASIRKFLKKPVEQEKIEALLRAAMAAPSAGNQQPWQFIVVRDPETLHKMNDVSPYAGPILNAPLGIVVLMDESGLRFPECVQQDLGAAAQNILLEAVSQGLGAVWMAVMGFEERVAKGKALFGLPDALSPFAFIAVGYPNETKERQDRYDPARVHWEKY
jgi:nitroreductase